MGRILLAAAFVMGACGSHATSSPVVRATATVTATSSVAAAPRATTPAALRCMVSFAHHYDSVASLAADAQLVVRATATAQDVVQLRPGFGPRATRDARRTTFAVTDVVRTTGERPSEIRVLEDVCPNLTASDGDEWLLFLYRWVPGDHGPDDPHDHWMSEGGPQGQFRIHAGKVSGPFWDTAGVVHSYEGAPLAEVIADIP